MNNNMYSMKLDASGALQLQRLSQGRVKLTQKRKIFNLGVWNREELPNGSIFPCYCLYYGT